MRKITMATVGGVCAALLSTSPVFAFSVYQMQTDSSGNARYTDPDKQYDNLTDQNGNDNGATVFQSGDSHFSFGTTGNTEMRPNSVPSSDSWNGVTGYYLPRN